MKNASIPIFLSAAECRATALSANRLIAWPGDGLLAGQAGGCLIGGAGSGESGNGGKVFPRHSVIAGADAMASTGFSSHQVLANYPCSATPSTGEVSSAGFSRQQVIARGFGVATAAADLAKRLGEAFSPDPAD